MTDIDDFKTLLKESENYEGEPLARKILFLLESVLVESQDLDAHLRNIVTDLDENDIDYAVIGGIALRFHNFLRHTDDIDLLVSRDSYSQIEKILIGRGYTYRPGSQKNLYYHAGGRKLQLDILIEGDKEGQVTLPNPKDVRQKVLGIWILTLPKLIDFKLNSGRGKDEVDVLRLIEANDLQSTFVSQLDEKVKDKFLDLFKKSSQK